MIVDRGHAGLVRCAARGFWRLWLGAMAGLAAAGLPPATGLAHANKAKHGHALHRPHATAHAAERSRHAAPRHHRKAVHKAKAAHKASGRPAGPVQAAILVDADSGDILSQSNADARAYPASLTKLMTLYLTFEALNRHDLTLDQELPVSARAAAQEPTKLWLKPGEKISVRSLILGLVTRSANDAAVVLAEAQAGSEAAFAARMTAMARLLGMRDTVYRNASGLPDSGQYTTARDLARLALALYRDFPHKYDYFSVRKFEFRGQEIAGHNHLLDWYDGADGLKTGFIRASGFNLAASAERDDRRLVGVVLGSPSWRQRDKLMAALLDRGFRALSTPTRVAGGDKVIPADPTDKAIIASMAKLAAYLSPAPAAHAAAVHPAPKHEARGASQHPHRKVSRRDRHARPHHRKAAGGAARHQTHLRRAKAGRRAPR